MKKLLCILITLITYFNAATIGKSQAMPNEGSPYRDLAKVETGAIVHLPTGVDLSFDQMIDTLSGARVIYIGETHDNIEAHRVQHEVIAAISERYPGKVAVGMEMFRDSSQEALNLWHRGKLADSRFQTLFQKNWGLTYDLYSPIFDLLKQKKIPLLGLKPSRATEKRFRENPDGEGFPEIDQEDKYYKAYAMSLFGMNPDHGSKDFNPYQMLLLWDETMADNVARFIQDPKKKDWKLIVLAGGFHVQYAYGIPKRAFRRSPHPYSILLPHVVEIPDELKATRSMKVGAVTIPLYSADFAWKIDYVVPVKPMRLGVLLNKTADEIVVESVGEESNAERLGVMAGDRIIRFDGESLSGRDDLIERLSSKKSGDRVVIVVNRNGSEQVLFGDLK